MSKFYHLFSKKMIRFLGIIVFMQSFCVCCMIPAIKIAFVDSTNQADSFGDLNEDDFGPEAGLPCAATLAEHAFAARAGEVRPLGMSEPSLCAGERVDSEKPSVVEVVQCLDCNRNSEALTRLDTFSGVSVGVSLNREESVFGSEDLGISQCRVDNDVTFLGLRPGGGATLYEPPMEGDGVVPVNVLLDSSVSHLKNLKRKFIGHFLMGFMYLGVETLIVGIVGDELKILTECPLVAGNEPLKLLCAKLFSSVLYGAVGVIGTAVLEFATSPLRRGLAISSFRRACEAYREYRKYRNQLNRMHFLHRDHIVGEFDAV